MRQKAILISDFTLSNFAGYLTNDASQPIIDATMAPFGQVIQTLMNGELDCWKIAHDIAVVWTRPDSLIAAFERALRYEEVGVDEILKEVDQYCTALRSLQERVRWIFVPSWVLPAYRRGFGALDLRPNAGIAYTLVQMNLRLIQNLENEPNFVVLDAEKWISSAGSKAFTTKLWYMGKIPFSAEVFKDAVREVKAAIRGLTGQSKKLVIVDLDDTLWSGVVGDVGWQGLTLGGHDAVGEALVDFQKELKALTNRGILLAIASKNEEATALEAITRHPEMILRRDDFAAWRINWKDKAANVLEIVAELNIGLDSAVFIDDNPVERARVREALPSVLVPDWPVDKLLYPQTLLALDCFDAGIVSQEDRVRSQMYVSQRDREIGKASSGSLADWLESLDTRVTIEPLNTENLARVVQLLNKTNQMNLTTRRLTSTELLHWSEKKNRMVFALRVSDRFGDSGLTGIVSTEIEHERVRIVDFILSCRVMGRNIEDAMLHYAFESARGEGAKEAWMEYLPTDKNKPCHDFLCRTLLTQGPESVFTWELDKPYHLPSHISLQAAPLLATT